MDNKYYDTVIVGGGIAGLTAAAYLARKKRKILLIEKNKNCGGLVSSFRHNGFLFEGGVRAIEDAGIVKPMLQDLGIELEFVKSIVSVGIENDILTIKDKNSLNDYKNLLKKYYPESKNEIENIIHIIKKVMKHMDVLYGIENPLFKDLKHDFGYLFKVLLPWLPKFIFTVNKINKMNKPLEDFIDTIIKNPSLKDNITQHFFPNTPAFFALSYFSLYLDYEYPSNGVGELTDAMSKKIIELGGEIKTETMINKVNANEKWVEDNKGNTYFYNNLIWAADLKYFYKNTNIEKLPIKIKSEFEAEKKKILSAKGNYSVFTLYLEVDEPLEIFKKISSGHFFYSPSRMGLNGLHTTILDNILNNWENITKEELYNWMEKFLNLNTFEISIPGLRNFQLDPKGKTGIIVSFLADYQLFSNLKKNGWLEEFRKKLENGIIKVLSKSIYPMLEDKIIDYFSFTPLDIKNRVGSSDGAIVGWSFRDNIPVPNTIKESSKAIFTSIPNIFKAGQWAYSPAGVPMSIITGKMAADEVAKHKPE